MAMFGYLRNAFSVACLIAGGLLVALGVRSHRTADTFGCYYCWGVSFESFHSRIEMELNSGETKYPEAKFGFSHQSYPNLRWEWPMQAGWARYGFETCAGAPGVRFISFPHWLPALVIGCVAAVPWIRRQRFFEWPQTRRSRLR
jgi:hypothetical protein